jgi:RNA polymerase sigma factor for flagellar operon FliA
MREMTRDEIRQAIINSIQELPEMEQKIVVLSFYEGLTIREIGLVMGIAELQTEQMYIKAMRGIFSKLARFVDRGAA